MGLYVRCTLSIATKGQQAEVAVYERKVYLMVAPAEERASTAE